MDDTEDLPEGEYFDAEEEEDESPLYSPNNPQIILLSFVRQVLILIYLVVFVFSEGFR